MSQLDQHKAKKEPKFTTPGWGGSVDTSDLDSLNESAEEAVEMADLIDQALKYTEEEDWGRCRCW